MAKTSHEMLNAVRESRQPMFPVVTDGNHLLSFLRGLDLPEVLDNRATFEHVILAGDVVHEALEVVTPDDSLLTALRRFGSSAADALPVVDTVEDRRVLGILKRVDLFSEYERALTESHV